MSATPHVLETAAGVIAGHQFRFKAGVPGCSCGESFTDGAGHPPATLHAVHVAPFTVVAILRAAAGALTAQLPAAESKAAVSVLAGMVRQENAAPARKALQQ